MLKRSFLLALTGWLLQIASQVEVQDSVHRLFQGASEKQTLRLFVEGDATPVKLLIEELRTKASAYSIDLAFANQRTDAYEARIIVTIGHGSVSDPMIFNHLPVSFAFSSAIVLSPDGEMLFTTGHSSVTIKGAITLVAQQVSKYLNERYETLKKPQRQQPADHAKPKPANAIALPNAEVNNAQDIPKTPGVYCRLFGEWIQLRDITAQVKASGTSAALLTWGFSKLRINQTFDGAQARLQIAEPTPAFYIVGLAVSDTEAAIVRLKKKKEQREVSVAALTAFNAETRFRDKDIVAVAVSRLAASIVKITPQTKLGVGEYLLRLEAFADASNSYDFGITSAKK